MSYKEVMERLRKNHYENKNIVNSLIEFCDDVYIIFRNCEFYNS